MTETCEECGLQPATTSIVYLGTQIAVCFGCKAKDRWSCMSYLCPLCKIPDQLGASHVEKLPSRRRGTPLGLLALRRQIRERISEKPEAGGIEP